jgi:HEAT repeat protein
VKFILNIKIITVFLVVLISSRVQGGEKSNSSHSDRGKRDAEDRVLLSPISLCESLPIEDAKTKAERLYRINSKNTLLYLPSEIQKYFLMFLTNTELATFANTCARANQFTNNRGFRAQLEKSQYLAQLDSADDDSSWFEAMSYLERYISRDSEIRNAILHQLQHGTKENNRSNIARYLGFIQYEEDVCEEVIKVLTGSLKDPSSEVRSAVAASLERLDPRDPVIVRQESLTALTSTDETAWGRAISKLAHSISTDAQVRDAFINQLQHGANENRRSSAAIFLRFIDAEGDVRDEVIKVLTESLKDPSSEVRSAVAASLGKLNPSYPVIVSQETVDALTSTDGTVWYKAINSLGNSISTDVRVRSALIDQLQHGLIEHRRSVAADCLGYINDSNDSLRKEVIQVLVPFVKDPSLEVRKSVIHSLKRLRKLYDSFKYDDALRTAND